MGLFARDKMYGGTRFEEFAPLTDVPETASRNGRLKAESTPFIVWECLGVTAADVPTSMSQQLRRNADKYGFIVSTIDNPAERIEVGTFASAIGGMIDYALDRAREVIAEQHSVEAGRDATFADLVPIAFDDLPAIARLQKVASSIDNGADALTLTLVSTLQDDPAYATIRQQLADAERAARRNARRTADDDTPPF